MPNGAQGTYQYDGVGRLTGLSYAKSTTGLMNLGYGYDETNRRTSYTGNPLVEPVDAPINQSTTQINSLNRHTTLNGSAVNYDNRYNLFFGNCRVYSNAKFNEFLQRFNLQESHHIELSHSSGIR